MASDQVFKLETWRKRKFTSQLMSSSLYSILKQRYQLVPAYFYLFHIILASAFVQ